MLQQETEVSLGFEGLIKELQIVEQQLMSLSEYEEMSFQLIPEQAFDGAKVSRQHLADMIAGLTHELSSRIGFARFQLQRSLAFIDFRKKYAHLSLVDLRQILMSDGSAHSMAYFLKNVGEGTRGSVHRVDVSLIKEIKQSWSIAFGSMSQDEQKALLSEDV